MLNIHEICKLYFENSGKRIKNFAVICFFINFIIILIAAAIFIIFGLFNIGDGGLLAIILAPICVLIYTFLTWVSTIFIFGFGELIENTKNVKKTDNEKTIDNKTPSKNNNILKKEVLPPINLSTDFNPCPVCGADISRDKTLCHVCGAYIKK